MSAKSLKTNTKLLKWKAALILVIISMGLFASRFAESKTLIDLISNSEPKYSIELKQLDDNSFEAKIYRMGNESGLFYESNSLQMEKRGNDKVYKDNRMTLLEKSDGQVHVKVDNGEIKRIDFQP